jgi:hypothetical protein
MVVPVRVRLAGGKGQPELAHTLDATESGVRLAGLRGNLNVGDVLEIQYRHEKALFRVVWFRALENSTEKHVGAECVEAGTNIWDVQFPAHADEYEERE